MIYEIPRDEFKRLSLAMKSCRFDLVIIDSVLEGLFGSVRTNSLDTVDVVRLDSGAFTVLWGDPTHKDCDELLTASPIYYVTPQNDSWDRKLRTFFGGVLNEMIFTEFRRVDGDDAKLQKQTDNLPASFALKEIDGSNGEKVAKEIGNDYFFENFNSLEDYADRGLGFYIEHEGRAVAAATSMAQSSRGIDIEIETVPEFRRMGLAAAVGAKLVLECSKRGLEPHWLAANPESGRLAEKLGFKKGGNYVTFEIGG